MSHLTHSTVLIACALALGGGLTAAAAVPINVSLVPIAHERSDGTDTGRHR